jgi:hypothetical protein
MPKKQPEAASEPEYEAMAETLNARGTPYIFFGVEFAPGVWMPITESQKTSLEWCNWAKIREKKVADGS